MHPRRILAATGRLAFPVIFPALMSSQSGLAVESHPRSERSAEVANRQRPLLKAALAEKGLAFGAPVFLRAFKESEELELWVRAAKTRKYELFRIYPIRAASGTLGPKLAEGDRQVPEGFYAFGANGLNPLSGFHLSFDLGFPNALDRHHGRTGSLIMVHGNAVSIGCLAMGDPAIEEIYTLVDAALARGQRVVRAHVFPFRMTAERLAACAGRESEARWVDFWANLREGYEAFERKRVPPEARLDRRTGRYVFR